jgi:hypothetical protein
MTNFDINAKGGNHYQALPHLNERLHHHQR